MPTLTGADCERSVLARSALIMAERDSLGQFVVGHSTNKKHGHSGSFHSPTYQSWHAMKQRCLNANHESYKLYGARGITICERWLTFANFLNDMEIRPNSKTLDRIDNNKGYEPGNCRWATDEEQHANQRHNGHAPLIYCQRGHEFTPENEIWSKGKRDTLERSCRECHRQRTRDYRAAKKALSL